ncbi:MAG: O-acetyl-ADP-ribose deacetylase [Gemmatimonadetes bacterium]|nr:O-acetyl-ADP-ribose deacetylase [Thermoleophilia bacterium]NJD18485.1 O-acetyl-ADP-ribose deacetylase [Gemmatimonadota bacterium]
MTPSAVFGATRVVLEQGDITGAEVDAVVNAANSSLLGGGGVDGAIHRAGGPRILKECTIIRAERGPLSPGEAVATTAGNMPADWVIHTVGPVWHGGGQGEAEILASAYRSSLRLARQNGWRKVAFPSISTGAYGYPVDQAARVALRTVKEVLEEEPAAFTQIHFVLFDANSLESYERALAELADPSGAKR